MLGAASQTNRFQAFFGAFPCRFSTDHPGQRDVFECSQLRQQKISLEYETHFLISKTRLGGGCAVIEISSLEFDRPGLGALQTCEGVEKCCLACTRSAG